MALCNKTAATVESTPPLKPRITLSFPNFSFKLATVVSTKAAGVQVCSIFAIFTKKFSNIFLP